MEKGIERTTVSLPTRRVRTIYQTGFLLICILVLLMLGLHGLNSLDFLRFIRSSKPDFAPQNPDEYHDFVWNRIKPTRYLNYTPCFGKFHCARLDVPMDWNSTDSDAPRVAIAVIRLPAPVPVTDHRYGGAIITNPGGPGGSGVDQILVAGEKYSAIINPISSIASSSDKYFDIISFDPRGVNNTTPRLDCFPDVSGFNIWTYQEEAEGIDRDSSAYLSTAWARTKAIASGCPHEDGIMKHMNTPPVVADIVEIIERHAQWRSQQADEFLASEEGLSVTASKDHENLYSRSAILERTRWRKGEEKLQFWGFSYGSLLGATFAALQPHRIGRMIIDGVEESDDYYNTAWLKNLRNTDEIMDKFYDYCGSVGPTKCALNLGKSSASDIRASVETLISELKEDPIAVPRSLTRGPEIITYSDVMQMIRYSLYKPLKLFPEVADLLSDLVYRDGTKFADFKQKGHEPSCPLRECTEKMKPCHPDNMETSAGILCSDGTDISNTTKEQFKEISAILYGESKWLGEVWATILMPCVHWKGKAKWRITGDVIKGNTSHPILLIGNTLDPVTPLSNAYEQAKRFPGSVVLQQDSEGHCSTSSPSLCTAKYIRQYFQAGQLPEPDTICQPEERPLGANLTSYFGLRTADDENVLSALKSLAEIQDLPNFLAAF